MRTVLTTASYVLASSGWIPAGRPGFGFQIPAGLHNCLHRCIPAVGPTQPLVQQPLGLFRQKHGGRDVDLTTFLHKALGQELVEVHLHLHTTRRLTKHRNFNPYPTAFPYGNGMVLHFYQQQESSTTKTVHKVINKGLKTYV